MTYRASFECIRVSLTAYTVSPASTLSPSLMRQRFAAIFHTHKHQISLREPFQPTQQRYSNHRNRLHVLIIATQTYL